MSVVIRGVKNAFRNTIRTTSIALILGISIGLALIMYISVQTVESKIASVKSSIGNTIAISPAGVRGFEGGGEPLTEEQMTQISAIDHVESVNTTLSDRLDSESTSLESATEAGSLGQRFNRGRGGFPGTGGSQINENGESIAFTPPITVTGTTNPSSTAVGADVFNLVAGELYEGDTTENVAVLGKSIAEKNSLSVGSTFTAYDTEITVVAIYDAGNDFANGNVLIPTATLQALAGLEGQVTSAIVQVDSIDSLAAVTSDIESALGDAADVVSSQDTSENAIEPLENIKSISTFGLFGSLGAGAVIIFLSMMMIVRERRREIGVLKAIGASNLSIVTQFISESSTLTLLGGVLGIIFTLLFGNNIIQGMASSSESTPTAVMGGMGGGGGMGGPGGGFPGRITQVAQGVNPQNVLDSLQANIGIEVLLYGLGAALIIAILGSALPAWMTAKVRPAEVMRGE